jgi:hypothetical protein
VNKKLIAPTIAFLVDFTFIIVVPLGALIGVCLYYANRQQSFSAGPDNSLVVLEQLAQREERAKRIQQTALDVMAIYASPASPAMQLITAQDIADAAQDTLETDGQVECWLFALGNESRFQQLVKSPTGPSGIGQTARAAFHEGLKLCGLPEAKDGDVWNQKLNLLASACYFRSMFEKFKGACVVAAAAYNQGPNHPAVKKYMETGRLDSLEASQYVSQIGWAKHRKSEIKENKKEEGK